MVPFPDPSSCYNCPYRGVLFLRNSTAHHFCRSHLALFESLMAIVLALMAWGCSGSASINPVSAVTVSPTSASLALGATQQFSVTVTGSSNTAVTWSVNGVPGGNPNVGTISNSGLYAAPALLSPGSVSVIATSQADSSKQASASVAVRQQVLAVAAAPAQGMTPAAALDMVLAAGGRGQGVDLHWPAHGATQPEFTISRLPIKLLRIKIKDLSGSMYRLTLLTRPCERSRHTLERHRRLIRHRC